MRVTQRMLSNNMLFSLQQNLANIQRDQERIDRGTKINKPSDDPAGFSQTLALQANLNLNGQYQRNITNGLSWLLQADSALDGSVTGLSTIRANVVQAANDTNVLEDRAAIAKSIDAMLDQLIVYANASIGNTYIFGGLKNTFPPFFRNGDNIVFTGDASDVLRDISPEGRYAVNVNGKSCFYDKLTNLLKGSGSAINNVDITNEQHMVKSFGVVKDADLAGGLNGKLILNMDGKDYEIIFSGENTVASMLSKINSVLGQNGQAYVDSDDNLIIESKSDNMMPFISVVSIDKGLEALKMLAGFNSLQFGKYQVSTANDAGPADSKAVLTDSYSQSKSTIVTNVGVTSTNELNGSILMEVIEVNTTNDHAEIISTGTLSVPGGINGQTLDLEIDGVGYSVTFSGISNEDDVVNQINAVLDTKGQAYLDGNGNLVIRSNITGQDSKVRIEAYTGNISDLGMSIGQSGAVGIIDTSVRFTYHVYDKDGNFTNGTITYQFEDDGSPRDGVPDTPGSVNIGGIDLEFNLTGFIQTGDKAVISVTAQSVTDDDSVSVGYDGKDRRYVFNDDEVNDGVNIRIFSLDEGNGEIYGGNIDLTFNGSISDSVDAAEFTAGNVFDCLIYLRKKVENEEQYKIEQMEFFLDEMIDNLLQEQVKVGARTNQFEAVNENYQFLEVNLNKVMADYYSTDVAKTLVTLEENMALYQASLYTGNAIMQAKLLDYLS